jgi:dCMP deaminase
MKPKFLDYFMKVAEATADLSTALRLKVGSVIVRDNQILATGYNGTPSGWDNNCEDKEFMSGDAGGWLDPQEIEELWPFVATSDLDGSYIGRYRLKTKPEVLHSEANAISKIARSTESSDGATLFCTHAPCLNCAKMIYQSGINSVYYRNAYRDTLGIEFLQKSGVKIERH